MPLKLKVVPIRLVLGPSLHGHNVYSEVTVQQYRPVWNVVLIFPLLVLAVAKLVQEYAIHHERWLDNITAVDAVESIWRFAVPF